MSLRFYVSWGNAHGNQGAGKCFLDHYKDGDVSHALWLVQRVGKELIFCDVTAS